MYALVDLIQTKLARKGKHSNCKQCTFHARYLCGFCFLEGLFCSVRKYLPLCNLKLHLGNLDFHPFLLQHMLFAIEVIIGNAPEKGKIQNLFMCV